MTVPTSPSSSSSAPRAGHRIAKLLARAGIASRREIERMITDGRVALDGKPVETPATILTSLRGVTVDGAPVEAPAPARLFLYHKPSGLLVTERDPAGRRTIYDQLPKDLPRLVPVGRLDLNTEGLLLLTTDGELKRQLELPSTGVERAYRARAYGQVSQAQLEELIEGVEIEGVRYGSINANLERRTGANVWVEMILTEGKNREVRRVLEFLGLKVSRLIRTRYGPFLLGDLKPGEIGEVRQHDVIGFRRDPTKGPSPERVDATRKAPAPRAAPAPVAAPARRGRPAAAPAVATERPKRPPRKQPSRPGDAEAPRATSKRTERPTGTITARPARPKRSRRPGDARPSRPKS
ncbi:pseudouridine synthase [Sphingomonas sp.]|uniref:pseudouridine synthase n=1 Tax=Sphingomonas sp. TaxID=28214 RepID=UPI0025F1CAE7|nr:pseudouridine synthase [Sphingomonas sp.]